MRYWSQQLLPVLQLTRMALVFTAIADSQCELLLRWGPTRLTWPIEWPAQVLAMVVVSVGLYGFGMSLNDIIDRRRDRHLAAHRPLPSGRIGVVTAHVICFLLAASAAMAGFVYARAEQDLRHGLLSVLLLLLTALLIVLYDLAAKYLVGLGLLTLGMIRLFHCLIPAPGVPLVWHPLLLLDHVAILSAVCYHWEEKRPAMTRLHWWGVFGGLAAFNLVPVVLIAWKRYRPSGDSIAAALEMRPQLALPLAAAVLFVAVAVKIRASAPTRREAGQRVMLYGLLWLIVYDAAFAAGYVSLLAGAALLMLLPVAYLSVQLMRWWSKLVMVSQRPQYQRATGTPRHREAP